MKTKKRKWLTYIFAVAMALTALTAAAFAEDGAGAQGTQCDGINCTHEAAVGKTHYDTLGNAVANANGQEIQLLKDIKVSGPVIVTSDTTINGANGNGVFQITPSTTGGNHRQGLFHLNNTNAAVTLTLKNMELVNKSWSNPCGVSVRASNQTVNLDNVTIDTGHYCVFVGVPGGENEDVNDVKLNIKDSSLAGYAAIYYRTNSTTKPIKNPVLNVENSTLTGRGVKGYSNNFSTIVFNGTRDARANISGSTLTNFFDENNQDAKQGIIQFNSYPPYEEGAEISVIDSVIKTNNPVSSPNVIQYSAGENLNVGNKVIVENTPVVDKDGKELISVMRNGNELVATGKDIGQVLIFEVPSYGDKPGGSTSTEDVSLLTGGDAVLIPVDTTLSADATIPAGVKVIVLEGAKLTIAEGAKLSGAAEAQLVVQGNVEGLEGIAGAGAYTWGETSWEAVAQGGTPSETKPADAAASPRTGDDSDLSLWLALMCASGIGLVGMLAYRRNRKTQ